MIGYWTTRGYANSRIANSQTGHLVDWSTRILDKSWTGQLADTIGDFACLVFVLLVASARPRVVQSATCPVRELAISELAYPRVVQLPDDIPIKWSPISVLTGHDNPDIEYLC